MEPVLEIINIDKVFVAVHAVNQVSFKCYPGTVHILQGENGAGKSTVMKIMSGLYQPDSGKILLDGVQVIFKHPKDARKKGISMVYQEMSILPELTVAQNIFLGLEENAKNGRQGLINERAMMKATVKLAQKYGIDVDPYQRAGDLNIASQQMLEILKALAVDSKIIILDEPTSALAKTEVDKLYEIVQGLKLMGKTILFVSHRMEEVFRFGDYVTVMKDGQVVDTVAIKDVTSDDIIRMMVGRDLKDIYPPKLSIKPTKEIFRVEKLCDKNKIHDISFSLMKGEVLGIAALEGQGQTQIMRTIAGVRKLTSGKIILSGTEIQYHSARRALKLGIGYVPEDRKIQGLCLGLSVKENLALGSLNKRQRAGFIDKKKEKEMVNNMIKVMNIRTPSAEQYVANLSGGNQQKVSIGKSLAVKPKVLLLNEPTRGIDVEAKQEIYRLIRELADSGVGILLYTSDMMEVIGLSDRIITVYEGRITSEMSGDNINEVSIMKGAMNV